MAYVINIVGKNTPLGSMGTQLPDAGQPQLAPPQRIEEPVVPGYPQPTYPVPPPPPPGGGGGGTSPFKKLFTAASYVPFLPAVAQPSNLPGYLPPRIVDQPTIPHPDLPSPQNQVPQSPTVPAPTEPVPTPEFPNGETLPPTEETLPVATSMARMTVWAKQHKTQLLWGAGVLAIAGIGLSLLRR